jgi:hypothetical protein
LDVLGEWVFHAVGTGERPAATMEVVEVTAEVDTQTSGSIHFRNPFPDPIDIDIVLDVDQTAAEAEADALLPPHARTFALLRKRAATVPPFAVAQVPFSFHPRTITEIGATVTIAAPDRDLSWKYTLRGIAEAPPSGKVLTFACQARTRATFPLTLRLPALPDMAADERFSHELRVPDADVADLVDKSLFILPINEDGRLEEGALLFDVTLEPLRPFEANLELVINKASGGRWRYDVKVRATEPEPDDIITIEASLNRTASVSFDLANQFPTHAPYKAHFTVDSAPEFSVHPREGVLPPMGTEGLTFVVSFTPREYGKTLVGKLVIETADMRWCYEVRGQHPHYERPSAKARIDNRIDAGVARTMAGNAARTKKRNIMKENMTSLRTASSTRGSTRGGGKR